MLKSIKFCSVLFSQNWSDNDAKIKRLQDFYDIFYLHV